MQWIHGWRDLESYGIDLLTGESCAYSYRYLCDVTKRGKCLLEACFETKLTLAEAWNSGPKDDSHIGSIMLAPQMLLPLSVFALLCAGCERVWIMEDGCVTGMSAAEDETARSTYAEQIARVIKNPGHSRNVHQFSGRTT